MSEGAKVTVYKVENKRQRHFAADTESKTL